MSNFILSLRFLLTFYLLFSVKGFAVVDSGFPSGLPGDGEPTVLSPPQLRKVSPLIFAVGKDFPSEADLSSIGDGTSPSPEHTRRDSDEVRKPITEVSGAQPVSVSTNSGGEAIDGKRQRLTLSQPAPMHMRDPETALPSPDHLRRKQRPFDLFVNLNPVDIETLESDQGLLTGELFSRVEQTRCITLEWPELSKHLLVKVSSGRFVGVSPWTIYRFILTNSYNDLIKSSMTSSVLVAFQAETEKAGFKLGTEDVRALERLSRTTGKFSKDITIGLASYLTLGKFSCVDTLWSLGNLILDSSLEGTEKRQVIDFMTAYQTKINRLTANIRESQVGVREEKLRDFLEFRLKEVYFSLEELGSSRRILMLLKDNPSYGELINITISRITTASSTPRMLSHSLKDLYCSTSHLEFARQFMAHIKWKFADDERAAYARLWDDDVDVLIRILDRSPELRGEAFDLAENVYLGRLNHSRTIRLEEALITYAPTSKIRDRMLDEMRYKYVKILQAKYSFKKEDVKLLEKLSAAYPFFAGSFQAILAYEKQRESQYFFNKAYEKVTPQNPLPDAVYLHYQNIIRDKLGYVLEERDISLRDIQTLEEYSATVADTEARRNLELLSHFLRSWYSHPLADEVHHVPVPLSLFVQPEKTEARDRVAEDESPVLTCAA